MSNQEGQAKILGVISGREPEAIARTIAMMAYIPAIGRALERGGVKKFQDVMWATIPRLYEVQASRDGCDALHDEICQTIISTFKTSRQQSLWYGQAQKPVNVFLKVYIDWAMQPTRELAEKLAPYLHVPLDSLLMKFFARELPHEYEAKIAAFRRLRLDHAAEGFTKLTGRKFSRSAIGAALGGQFSLKGMEKDVYLAWQRLFRSLYPAKPVMLDIIWFAERLDLPGADG